MPVPSSIADLSTTAASNSPPGTEAPSSVDNYLRSHASFIAQIRAVIGGTPNASIPSDWATSAEVTAAIAASVVDASETAKGVIEIATSAEAIAGTDTVRAVNPSGLAAVLAAKTASATAAGFVELATVAEAQAGTDTARAVTPEGLVATAIGYGQTWQDLTGSRAGATAYQNTTGKPIQLGLSGRSTTSTTPKLQISANGSTWQDVGEFPRDSEQSRFAQLNHIVPNGWYYRTDIAIANYVWGELR